MILKHSEGGISGFLFYVFFFYLIVKDGSKAVLVENQQKYQHIKVFKKKNPSVTFLNLAVSLCHGLCFYHCMRENN